MGRDTISGQLLLTWQVGRSGWRANLQHRDQLHVTIAVAGADVGVTAREVGEGFAIAILDLSLDILWPIQHAERIPEMFVVVGAQLEIDEYGFARLQMAQLELERRGLIKK